MDNEQKTGPGAQPPGPSPLLPSSLLAAANIHSLSKLPPGYKLRLPKHLFEIKSMPEGTDPDELFKHRFLCRKGGLLFVGQTGIGKSSWLMQAMIHWALGLPFMGIVPVKPIKFLLVQAENDDGDLSEMRDGVLKDMSLTPEQTQMAFDNIVFYTENGMAGEQLTHGLLTGLLPQVNPDILVIDPALSYIQGDSSSQRDVGTFLRLLLNPVLTKFNVGVIIIHHTGKPRGEKVNLNFTDHAYSGVGSSEWSNWARAVISLQGSQWPGVYVMRAAKRGERLRWLLDGRPSVIRLLKHDERPGVIKWHELSAEETQNLPDPDNASPKPSKTQVRIDRELSRAKSLIPADEPGITRQDLLRKIQVLIDCSESKAKELVKRLEVEGHVTEKTEKGQSGGQVKTYWLNSTLDLESIDLDDKDL